MELLLVAFNAKGIILGAVLVFLFVFGLYNLVTHDKAGLSAKQGISRGWKAGISLALFAIIILVWYFGFQK